jgi:hypothetical protein
MTMSHTMNARNTGKDIRWRLLTSVSATALLVSVYAAGDAQAADNDRDRPLVWIELGGQLEQLTDPQEKFAPAFLATVTNPDLASALNVQSSPAYALGEEAKISLEPEGSNWVFSAAIRYGRQAAHRAKHHQTPNAPIHLSYPTLANYYPSIRTHSTKYPAAHVNFADASARESERHAIFDFQAGKDVGLGMFGSGASSTISAGVRIAQFNSSENVRMRAEPDVHYPTSVIGIPALVKFIAYGTYVFHDDAAVLASKRSFDGIGPSLSWTASAPIAGTQDAGMLSLDWGANAAVLFGRQKARGNHQTTVKTYYKQGFHNGNVPTAGRFYTRSIVQHTIPGPFDRSRNVTVPNLGGFAGVSYRYADAKISFGYRADMFFGAIDGGIDTRKSENRGFYGPYASISIGLGD